jgi:molybdate transport system ATP-binding protein
MLELEAKTRLGELELDLELGVADGQCLALAGPSGAGKTSALRIVAGLLRPSAGRVRCGTDTWLDIGRGIDLVPERRRCGYLFQDYALFPHMSAWQNIAYALHGQPRQVRRSRAGELLERFGIGELADARPSTLSGGERQRVALARSLAREPRVLLLDEPLSALDARTRAASARELEALVREAGVPTLLVTHDFAEAARLADRIAVVDRGRIIQTGTSAELAARPSSAFVADFSGATVLSGFARPGAGGLIEIDLDGCDTTVSSTDNRISGAVAVSVHPWDVTVLPGPATQTGSARNHLTAEVVSLTSIGSRVRLGLDAGQPLSAEVTSMAASELGLVPGRRVVATWKASATRVSGL